MTYSHEHNKLVHTGVIQTFNGGLFAPLDLSVKSIKSIDYRAIARGCSNICRFGGQVKEFYSVAQHQTIMARIFRADRHLRLARWALLHDSAEGLGLCDMPRPIKYMEEMRGYRLMESATQKKIFRRFGLYGNIPKVVKKLDYSIVFSEATVLLESFAHPEWLAYAQQWEKDKIPLIPIKPYSTPLMAEREFLKEFKLLFPRYV